MDQQREDILDRWQPQSDVHRVSYFKKFDRSFSREELERFETFELQQDMDLIFEFI